MTVTTEEQQRETRKRSSRHDRHVRRWHARNITTLKRLAGCGRWDTGQPDGITIRQRTDTPGAYFSGVQHCASPWSCPVCSVTIGQRRAAELADGLQHALDNGHGAHFVTFTIEHHRATRLGTSLDQVIRSFRKMLTGREWQAMKARYGMRYVRSIEATYGDANGWHPHAHAVFFTDRPLEVGEREFFYRWLFARWERAVAQVAGVRCSPQAFHAEPVEHATQLGHYLIKVGLELHRSDLKGGKPGRYSPMELLDQAACGQTWARALWREWEQATKGRRSLTWSRGCRTWLGLDATEKTDDELAAEMQGGQIIAHLDAYVWHKVTTVPGLDSDLLAVAEGDGARGVIDFLRSVRLIT